MNTQVIRWGFIGLGNIAHKFAEGLTEVQHATLHAVASSSKERAKAFAEQHGAECAYGNYEALAKAPDVDVVYIASYNTRHFEHAKLCLENGKHVLCEKPLTTKSRESKLLFELARKQNLFFMEALWTLFMPSVAFVQSLMESQEYGALQRIDATFGFPAAERNSARLYEPGLGGGALYDIGIYPIFLAHRFLGKPLRIDKQVERGETGVDIYSSFTFHYPNAKANLSCSFKEFQENEAHFYFEKAKVVFGSMWHMPTHVSIITSGEEKEVPMNWIGNGYNYEAQFVTNELLQGKTSQDFIPEAFSVNVLKIIEQLLAKP